MTRFKGPLVSILIPAYNAQDWLADTICSALAQTWTRKEIIIVDDGSRDETLAIARQFECGDVRVIATENAGAAVARNTAYAISQGDYIQWLDADDLLSPDKIELQVYALRENDTDGLLLSCPWGYFAHRPQKARFHRTPLWQDLSPIDWLSYKMGDHYFMQTSTWLVSRALSEVAGPWDSMLTFDDDGEYFCRVLLASSGTRFVENAKVFYRNAASNRLSHIGMSDTKMDSLLRSMKLHVQYLRSLEDSDRVRDVCCNYLQTWSVYFDPDRQDLTAELQAMAGQLERELMPPKLRWKYAWMGALFGIPAAWRAQIAVSSFRHRAVCAWDEQMARLENKRMPEVPARCRHSKATPH